MAALALVLAGAAAADDGPAKEQKVRKLLEVTNAAQMGIQVMDQMIGAMKDSTPGAPPEFWTTFRSKFTGKELVDLLVPIYLRNLEERDLDAAIGFFGSPAGQRFVSKQGVIAQESMQAGQEWGAAVAMQALQELEAAKAKQ
jgi:hypothetical protein